MKDPANNPILKLSFEFSLAVIAYCDILEQKKKWVMANQLLRSGMSIGANSREAQNAESKPDFIHKFKIAGKEADETVYWLEVCQAAPSYPNCENLLEKAKVLQRIINKILGSSNR